MYCNAMQYNVFLPLLDVRGQNVRDSREINEKNKITSGRGRLWWPALGVVKTLHTDNTQHKDNMKT